MKYQEIKQLSEKDLHKKLQESRVKVRELRFSVANNQLKNVREIRKTRSIIAKILTVLNLRGKTIDPASQSQPQTDKNSSTSLEINKA